MTDMHMKNGIAYDLIKNYDKTYCWEKGHKISMFRPPIWHFGGHVEKEDGHFE